ncbi:MAG: HK97 family phage prohead protease [Turicibacter sp.]
MKVEIRNNSINLDGYVNVVNRESRILPSPRGKFIEHIVPGAFKKALEQAEDVKLLFNHSEHRQLGSIKQGNLSLNEDVIGLRAKCTVNDAEIIDKAKRNELRGWSFGFRVLKDEWNDGEDGIQRRSIQELQLNEVSILDRTPAYYATSIEERADAEEFVFESRGFDEITVEVIELEDEKRDAHDEEYQYNLNLIKLLEV